MRLSINLFASVVLLFVCAVSASWGQCPPPGVLPGDTNQDGDVDFGDFLVLSDNFGKPGPKTWSQGDFNCNGQVDFADFLALNANFADYIPVQNKSQFSNLLDNERYIVFSQALVNFGPNESINIDGVNDTQICFFQSPFSTDVEFASAGDPDRAYGDDYGAVNVTNCNNLEIADLEITNTRTYVQNPKTLYHQSSCALNIGSSSNVTITNPKLLKGQGKSVVLVHGNSTVTINGSSDGSSRIESYYYGLNAGASDVTVNDVTFGSDITPTVPGGDNHPALYTAVAYTAGNSASGNAESRNGMKVTLNDCKFELENGKAIVACGSSEPGQALSAEVILNNAYLDFPLAVDHTDYGLLGYASSWIGVTLVQNGGTVRHSSGDVPISNILVPFTCSSSKTPTNLVGTVPNSGLGKFNHYQQLNAQGKIKRQVDAFPTLVSDNTLVKGVTASEDLDVNEFDPNDPQSSIYD